MPPTTSRMRREINEIPDAVERLLTRGTGAIEAAARDIETRKPPFLATVARGSSDHVATYIKYASELLTGTPVASLGPSVASVYRCPLKLGNSACLSISQSGASPDIVQMARNAGSSGALTIAITNHPDSALAQACAHCLHIHAGTETSVAATKTFVTSLVAGLMLIAHWQRDADLIAAIHKLPDLLAQAARIDWPRMRAALDGWNSLYTLGRGPAFAISNEAALKFKETSQIHAESYSSAEVLHGPVSLVGPGFPVLCFAASDAAEAKLVEVADQVAARGAAVFVTSDTVKTAQSLPNIRTAHRLTDPVSLIVSFYAMVEQVAVSRGLDPDAPRHLQKVTKTL